MINNDSKTQLTNGTLIAYGSLALPIAIADLPIILYLPAFYAKEVGLNIGMVGLVFLFARLWDGFSDPIIGTLSDRTTSRFGRRKPWVIVGAPLLMIAAWFLCNPPQEVGLLYLFLWAILFYTAQTIMRIPYWSWGAELSQSYDERSKVTGFRESAAMIGNLVVASAPLLFLPKDAPVRDVLFLIAVLLVILIPATTVPLVSKITDQQSPKKLEFQFIRDARCVAQNTPFIKLLTVYGLVEVSLGVLNSVAIFLVGIALGLPNEFFSLFFIEYVAAILFAPAVVRLANKFGKHITMGSALLIMVVIYLIGFILPMGSYLLTAICICCLGLTLSCIGILPTSILADVIDYDTATSGEPKTGIYVAVLNLSMKLGLALGVGITYGFLALVGFDPSASNHNAEDVLMVRMAGFGLTSILLIPAIYILWKFPITKNVQRELRRRIDANNIKLSPGRVKAADLANEPLAAPLRPNNP